jgi:hypothetical protein
MLLSTPFSNTLCTSLNVSDEVSYSYRTTGKIIHIFICSRNPYLVIQPLDIEQFKFYHINHQSYNTWLHTRHNISYITMKVRYNTTNPHTEFLIPE